MVHGLVDWIRGGFRTARTYLGGGHTEDEADTSGAGDYNESTADTEDSGDDDGQFIPSRLDASVLEAHGMGTSRAERELESIQEKARTLAGDYPDDEEHR